MNQLKSYLKVEVNNSWEKTFIQTDKNRQMPLLSYISMFSQHRVNDKLIG